MPLHTENLNLTKPTRDERYDIAVSNYNMDIIDETVRQLREELEDLGRKLEGMYTQEEVDALLAQKAKKRSRTSLFNILTHGLTAMGTFGTLENQCFISGYISTDTGTLAVGQTLGVLPDGCKPTMHTVFPAIATAGDTWSQEMVVMSVSSEGEISALKLPQNTNGIYIYTVFDVQ